MRGWVQGGANSRYLVTGGSGCIGSHLFHELTAYQQQVDIFYSKIDFRKFSELTNMIFVSGDILDTRLMNETINKFWIEDVYHLASLKSASESFKDELRYQDINIQVTQSVLNICKASKLHNVVFA